MRFSRVSRAIPLVSLVLPAVLGSCYLPPGMYPRWVDPAIRVNVVQGCRMVAPDNSRIAMPFTLGKSQRIIFTNRTNGTVVILFEDPGTITRANLYLNPNESYTVRARSGVREATYKFTVRCHTDPDRTDHESEDGEYTYEDRPPEGGKEKDPPDPHS